MIIACPACATRYVVPETAVGIEGRTVRCAKCRNSWFQEGPPVDAFAEGGGPRSSGSSTPKPDAPKSKATAPAPPEPSETAPASNQGASGDDKPTAPLNEAPPEPSPAAEPSTAAEPDRVPYPEPPESRFSPAASQTTADAPEESGSRFDYEPPFRPRRNPLKVWTAVGAVFALLVFGAIAAVSYWGLPEWVPVSRPTFAVEQPDLVLDFPADQQDRRTLPNGTEFFGASGTVTNVGRETRTVPSILIVMRDGRDRIVYSWEVVPSQGSLDPGETLRINEAVTDVPKSARFAEIGWKPA